MGQYFLASVGTANAFVRKTINGVEGTYHAFTARTLTESSLSFTSTQEDVRAGQGAKLYGRFSHDTGMTISMTDAMFKLEYLAMQVSAEIKSTGAAAMFTEQLKYTSGGFTLSKSPMAMGKSCGLDKIGVWFRPIGCDAEEQYFFKALDSATQTVTSDDAIVDKEYCVTYFTDYEGAREMLINADFVPAEMILILTTKLFAGDASNPDSGRPVGEITVKIPRFQLDGSVDLSMAMSSASTFALNGTALAVNVNNCTSDGIYAEIVEVINGRKWYEGLVAAFYSEDDDAVFGVYAGGYTSELDSTLTGIAITKPTAGTAGSVVITDGSYTRTISLPALPTA